MAVPTFTSATPAVGQASGGTWVEITGTNFRTAPTALTDPEVTTRPVEVTFDGRQARIVQVISATLIRALAPPYDPGLARVAQLEDPNLARVSYPAVDIVITNLDNAGAPIAGETVTEAAAFTYVQTLLFAETGDPVATAAPGPIGRALAYYIRRLQADICSRVAWLTHTDYAEGTPLGFAVTAHPAVSFRIAIAKDPDWSQYENSPITVPVGDGTWKQFRPADWKMLVIDQIMSGDNLVALNLVEELCSDLSNVGPFLIVPSDPRFVSGEKNYYPIEITREPRQVTGVNTKNITAFEMQLRIRGIPSTRTDLMNPVVYPRTSMFLGTGPREDPTAIVPSPL